MRCDLHAHSTRSDGTLRPADLVERASQAGVAVLALTDHDDVDGLPEAEEAARQHGVELVPGVELSVSEENGKRQLHVLGLGIDRDAPELRALVASLSSMRSGRAERIVSALARAGVELDLARVREIAGDGAIGRPHLARALVDAGACRDHEEAFSRYLRRGKPGFVERTDLHAHDAISAVHSAGGVAVLAHPPRSVGVDEPGGLDAFVARLVESGLDGLELQHPSHQPRARKRIRKLAREFELILTGGSDYHGEASPGVELGRGRHGNVDVRAPVYEALMARRDRVQA